jgi:type VI secretion system protein ImpK
LRFKSEIANHIWLQGDAKESSVDGYAAYIQRHVVALLRDERQKLMVILDNQSFLSNHVQASIDALYVITAFADEIFLNLDWEGRLYWEQNILEEQVFQSHKGGEEVFVLYDHYLMGEKDVDLSQGYVYLQILGLGFRGKYRGFDDHGVINSYKTRLYYKMNKKEANLENANTILFPQAYNGLIAGDTPRQMPGLQRWHLLLGGIIGGYLLISSVMWSTMTSDIGAEAEKILLRKKSAK